ncbi:MAG: LemA family protein [Nitrospiraceae bacterium]
MRRMRGTLESVVQARADATKVQLTPELLKDEAAFKKFQEAQQGLSSALGLLFALAENYPNLKADQNFRDLQSQLEGTENRITVARKRYIDKVAEFNKMVRYFIITAKFLLHLEESRTSPWRTRRRRPSRLRSSSSVDSD